VADEAVVLVNVLVLKVGDVPLGPRQQPAQLVKVPQLHALFAVDDQKVLIRPPIAR
jgi:hypothetical protein